MLIMRKPQRDSWTFTETSMGLLTRSEMFKQTTTIGL